eukprot:4389479-Amphidinium_carterae.1
MAHRARSCGTSQDHSERSLLKNCSENRGVRSGRFLVAPSCYMLLESGGSVLQDAVTLPARRNVLLEAG